MVGSRRQFERMCDAISISKLRPIITVFDFADSRKVCAPPSPRLHMVLVFLIDDTSA